MPESGRSAAVRRRARKPGSRPSQTRQRNQTNQRSQTNQTNQTNQRSQSGQATLEYVGALFLVVMLVSVVIVQATPIGEAIAAKICQALGSSCGTSAAQQRATALGITCVVARTDNELGAEASFEVRAEHGTKGSLTTYGNGTGQIVLSDNQGIGGDLGTALGKYAEAKLEGTVNGEVGLVYKFPKEYGGADGAKAMFGDRRDAAHAVIGLVVPGAQVIQEAGQRVWDAASNFWSDHVSGSSAADRQARDAAQRAATADAVQVSLSVQGSAGIDAGAGVKQETKKPDGSTDSSDLRAPVAAGANAELTVRGTMTVPLHTDGPDAVSSSFTGQLGGDLSAYVSAGGLGPVPPILQAAANGGASGSYTVTFDREGNPSRLTLSTQTEYGYGFYAKPNAYDKSAKASAGGKDSTIQVLTQVLDLNTGTPQGAANRAAFDQVFYQPGISAGGYTGKAVLPKALLHPELPGGLDVPQLISGFTTLQQRVDADAFTTTSDYTSSSTEYGGDIKVAGVGLGGTYSQSGRQLTGSSAHDNRNGTDVQLASCPGS